MTSTDDFVVELFMLGLYVLAFLVMLLACYGIVWLWDYLRSLFNLLE